MKSDDVEMPLEHWIVYLEALLPDDDRIGGGRPEIRLRRTERKHSRYCPEYPGWNVTVSARDHFLLCVDGETVREAFEKAARQLIARYLEHGRENIDANQKRADEWRATMAKTEAMLAHLPPEKQQPKTKIVGTGVRAPEQIVEQARARSKEVRDAPVAFVMGAWVHEETRETFMTWLDVQATLCGLPAAEKLPDGQVDHYGMDDHGEFTRMVASEGVSS